VSERLAGVPIVCVGLAEWDAEIRTNQHHLMSRLARTNDVLFVESLGLRRPTTSARDVRRMARRLRRGLRPLRRSTDVSILSPLVIPLHGSGAARRVNRFLLRRGVVRATRKLGFERPVVWGYAPQAIELVDLLDPRLVVYHCVDDLAAQAGVDAESFRRYEEAFAREADLVITSASPLRDRLARFADNVQLMTNVADTGAFSRALESGPADPVVGDLPRPRIVFVGAISATKLDLSLISEMAHLRSAWSFVLVGPVGVGDPGTDVSRLLELPNVTFLGPREQTELPALFRAMDAGIIPYRVDELTRSVFPMKVYEYLAAGLPTVATPLPAIREVEGISFAETAADMVHELETAIRDDSEQARQDRSRLARSHSWETRLDDIDRAVGELQWRS
jgi:glycosyltransferase involved in cell wall biosynthesis